jgi:hypothetical protein
VTILDRHGLEQSANGLYGVPEAEFERLFPDLIRTWRLLTEPSSKRTGDRRQILFPSVRLSAPRYRFTRQPLFTTIQSIGSAQ